MTREQMRRLFHFTRSYQGWTGESRLAPALLQPTTVSYRSMNGTVITDQHTQPTSPGASGIPYGPGRLPWEEQVPAGAVVTPPAEDPVAAYPQVPPPDATGDFPRIDYSMFEIPPTGLTEEQRTAALAVFRSYAEAQHANFMGFQATQNQSYSARLSWLLDMHTNNIGDPFQSGLFTLNSKFCERAVLDYFAALWNNNWPHTAGSAADRYWGYVLTMGCTEANIYGLFNGRDYLKGRMLIEDPQGDVRLHDRLAQGKEAPEKRFIYADPITDEGEEEANPNAYKPIVFYSEDAHYSVVKAVRLLELTTFYQEGNAKYPGQCPITRNGEWPEEVPSHNYDRNDPLSGTVRIDDLTTLVRFFAQRGYPILIVLNVGTTWKGAYDDVPAVNKMLKALGEEFPWLWNREVRYDPDRPWLNDRRRGFWVHVDGALGAPLLPFVEMAYNRGLIDRMGPVFDFRNEAVMSIGCSMHKWIGGPWPSGIYMTRAKYQLLPPDSADLIGSADTTLGGSRSGFSTMIFWDYFSRMSYEQNMLKAVETEQVAAYMEERLRDLERRLREKFGPEVDLWIARSRLALTVRFRLANPAVSYKWTLDSERLWVPTGPNMKQLRSYSHVFVMGSVDRERVDGLIDDLWRAAQNDWHDAFPRYDGDQPNPGAEEPYNPPARGRANYRVAVPHQGRGWKG